MTTYACTLDAATSAQRLPADRALAARVAEVTRTDTGAVVRVHHGDEATELVDTFITNERHCCGFFDLARRDTDEHVELLVDAPDDPTAQELVDQLVHAMRSGAAGA